MNNVKSELREQYRLWSPYDRMVRLTALGAAYADAGVHFKKHLVDRPVMAVAHHEAKQRLGRKLTVTELQDILGWACN